jgi:hypothetical protein
MSAPVLLVDIGQVGDAADVEHGDRPRPVEDADQGAMKDRHHRRPLSAGGHVGGAKIVDDGDAEPLGERRAVAELHRQPPLGAVQHGLPMKADHRDRVRRHGVRGEERLHRLGMHVGHPLLRLGEEPGPLRTLRELSGGGDRPAQQLSLAVAVGAIAGGTEAADPLAVGLDQRHIHPVAGGAAHQADRAHLRHAGILARRCRLNPAADLLHHRRRPLTCSRPAPGGAVQYLGRPFSASARAHGSPPARMARRLAPR